MFLSIQGVAQPNRTLVVGADVDYAPFTYLSGGKPVGFDIDLFDLVAQEMDVVAEYRLEPWAEIHRLAKEQAIDVILSVVYTTERDTYLDFTVPYNSFQFAVAVRKGSSIDALEDLRRKSIAYLKEDAVAPLLMASNEIQPEYVPFDTLAEAFQSVAQGETHAVIAPQAWIRSNPEESTNNNLRIVKEDLLVSTYRMAVPESDPGLLDELDRAITKIKAGPEYRTLEKKWFGRDTHGSTGSIERSSSVTSFVIAGLAAVIAIGFILFWLIQRKWANGRR